MRNRRPRAAALLAGSALIAALVPLTNVAASAEPDQPEVDCGWTTNGSTTREAAFTRAATEAGVPEPVLKAVSYMESRWESHGGRPSADGGYGPMNLTDLPTRSGEGRGDGSSRSPESASTARAAAKLTGLDLATVKSDANANICAGAAVLASYQGDTDAGVNGWADAVARYGAAGSGRSSKTFANQVYAMLRSGGSHATADGAKVALRAQPSARKPFKQNPNGTDCPKKLGCEWIEAPYAKSDPTLPDDTGSYGNHDIADRTGKRGPKLKYIVIHDTEATYDTTLDLVQDPTYLAWNYTIRSTDGHVAQHLDPKDVGWHAGNWYMNMHSIGIEHEGKGGNGGWFTESMYQSSSTLVRYLAKEHRIPLDRNHIIGHDQIPGILPGYTEGVHWDPGPYWDWEHYFDLLKKPIGGHKKTTTKLRVGDVVTVRPGFTDNKHADLTGCEEQSPGSGACDPAAGTNYATLYQQPSTDAPLAADIGTHPDGSASTTVVNDVSARAAAGTRLVVSGVAGYWVKVSWAGESAWIQNPHNDPVLVRSKARSVSVPDGATSAPVYGRAYPEEAAYPADVPVQAVTPIEYTLKPGQKYVLADAKPVTDYYMAKSFDGSLPGDRTDVVGSDRYYQIELAHRTFFVRADDVVINRR